MRASRALQHHEARAGELRRRLEIHLAERLAELEMLLRPVRLGAARPSAAPRRWRVSSGPTGTSSSGTFGMIGQRIVQRLGRRPLLLLGRLDRILQRRDLGHQRLRARLVLLRLGLADLLRRGVAAGLRLLQLSAIAARRASSSAISSLRRRLRPALPQAPRRAPPDSRESTDVEHVPLRQ